MTFALQAQGIRKSFGGVEVLHGVDLDAIGGSVLALLGENGAGKSTLVKIIAGDYTPDGGEIVVDEVAYPSLTPIAARDLGRRHHLPGVPGRADADRGREHLARSAAQPVRGRRLARRRSTGPEDPQGARRRHRTGSARVARCASASGRSSRSPEPCRGSARLLILDEPTAALSHHETERSSRSSGGCATRAWRSSTSPTGSTRSRPSPTGSRSCATATWRCSPRSAETDRAAMIEAMVGRRIAEIRVRPSSVRPASEPPHPLDRRRFRRELHGTPRSRSTPARSWRIYGKLGSGAAEVGETAYGLRPVDRRRAWRSTARRRRSTAPSPASRPASASCRPIARRAAPSWSGRSRRTWPSPRGAAWRRSASSSPPDREQGLSTLARQAVHPLAQRPAPGDGHAVRRQPAEGAAEPLARAQEPRPRPHRADPRRRCRRAPGHLSRAARPRGRGRRGAHLDVRLRGGGAGRRPGLCHVQGRDRGTS